MMAVVQYIRQLAGNPHVLSALAWGLGLLLLPAAGLAVAWWAERRARTRGE